MAADYAKELGAMGMGGGKDMPMGDDSDADYSAAKEAAASSLATALGLDPASLDLEAVCNAVKQIVDLED